MSIVVFWMGEPLGSENGEYPCARVFTDAQLGEALELTKALRQEGKRHVTVSSELSNQVGKNGVDAVVDGKLPSGEPYEWKKRRL